jgi:YVTN family beta-propeller protein
MEFRILGPLEVLDGDRQMALGGARQRALLAILLLHANKVVSTDRLVDELWGETPPESGPKALQVAVSQLRKALQTAGTDGRLVTRPPGYVLQVGEGELDRDRFDRLVAEAADEPDASERAAKLRNALALWRGPALADLTYEAFAAPAIARLEDMRLAALEERIDADLELGRHTALVGELEELVRAYPLRERIRGQLMLALYRSGRQAEALAAFQAARRELVDELGIEPGPELQKLHKRILEQDTALGPPTRVPRTRGTISGLEARRTRWLVAGLGLALLAAAGIAAVLLARGGGTEPVAVTPNSVAVVDPATNEVVDAVPVGDGPGPIAAGGDSVWVVNLSDRTLMKIDAAGRSVIASTGLPVGTGRLSPTLLLAIAPGDVWVHACHLELFRVDPATARIVQELEVFREIGFFFPFSCAVAAGAESVWTPIDEPSSQLLRVAAPEEEPATIAERFPLPAGYRSAMTLGAGSVWIADTREGIVRRIDPATGDVVATIRSDPGLNAMVFGHGSVWVTNDREDSVLRIRPSTNSVVRAISVGAAPSALAVGPDAIWVANSGDGTVSRVDPSTSAVTDTIRLGHRPLGVAVGNGLVWVTVRS